MSSRGKNHTRGTMQAWREMAAEGYPSSSGRVLVCHRGMPQLLKRNARWRPIVRMIAKERGWRFIDAYLHTYVKGFPVHLMLGAGYVHYGVKNAKG